MQTQTGYHQCLNVFVGDITNNRLDGTSSVKS